ncbi:hypothetical protein T01_3863 [Trichinella spiralis]|uniref:Uncharacterized protein n=1 Tax=Trichinella spiralis TaxID=6334 RepID=A0A0V1BPY9_TRISP|nr:hypothetical protein T01_3863 [Trichinella spiralis]
MQIIILIAFQTNDTFRFHLKLTCLLCAKQMNSEGKNKETMNKHAYLLSSANARVVRNFYDATDALSNQIIV